MKTISIVTPCYNEQDNVEELWRRIRDVMATLDQYSYEHIFIDNASSDMTAELLRRMAAQDTNVKVILNARNFGHIRSPMHGILQACGDAVIGMAADFQDPPELIPALVERWEQGFAMVLCIKETSEENRIFFWLRRQYYRWINRLSSLETFENFTGFGLFDRKVIDIVRTMNDRYPYFRGLIAEIGLPHAEVKFVQPRRKRGFTKNNLYTLYDLAMLGLTNLSKVPLRIVTFFGFVNAIGCILVALSYFIYKLVFWSNFSVGTAPLVIGLFFLGSVQLVCMGILGEYIGAIHTQVHRRPYVIEKERINFDSLTSGQLDAELPPPPPLTGNRAVVGGSAARWKATDERN